MKFLFTILLVSISSYSNPFNVNQGEGTQLKPCPNSPNCVSTQETRRSKSMKAIQFLTSSEMAIQKLEQLLATYSNATLVKKDDNYLHYEFKTRIGKFIDDVEFVVDNDKKEIHFRSASRKGYGDIGKNKRRMKMIIKDWNSHRTHL